MPALGHHLHVTERELLPRVEESAGNRLRREPADEVDQVRARFEVEPEILDRRLALDEKIRREREEREQREAQSG